VTADWVSLSARAGLAMEPWRMRNAVAIGTSIVRLRGRELNWLQAHIDGTGRAAYNLALMASIDEWLENPSTQTQVQLPRTRSTRRHSALSLLLRKQPEVFRATRGPAGQPHAPCRTAAT
jgi:hypothetical protein